MRNVVLDSDILIDHLRGFKPAKDVMVKVGRREVAAFISGVTEAELLSGAECRDLRKKRLVVETIKLFTKVPVDNKISQKAGEFRRRYGVPLLDAIVGATAFYKKAELWTRNVEHFRKIKEISARKIY
jgi:hypothetical protein